MKLRVIGLVQDRLSDYVSVQCLLPDGKEKINVLKESLSKLGDDDAKVIATMFSPLTDMVERMMPGEQRSVHIPIEWDDFTKLDLKLGDWLELKIIKSEIKKAVKK